MDETAHFKAAVRKNWPPVELYVRCLLFTVAALRQVALLAKQLAVQAWDQGSVGAVCWVGASWLAC